MLRMIHWMRVGLIGALLLALGPLLAIGPGKLLVGNLFIVHHPVAAAWVAVFAIIAAWNCGLPLALVRRYASLRMLDAARTPAQAFNAPAAQPAPRKDTGLKLAGYSLLAAPGIFVMLVQSHAGAKAWIAVAVASAITIGVGATISGWFWRRAERAAHQQITSPLASFLNRWPWAAAGYVRPLDDTRRIVVLHSGHLVAAGIFVVQLIVYIILGLLSRPSLGASLEPPTLIYILIIFMMNITFLAGLAFFLDRFRIPLLPIVIGWNAICLSLNPAYTFLVYPTGTPAAPNGGSAATLAPITLPDPAAPLAALPPHGPFHDTIVVVCASGGGIQSAAWTTRVLTWLQEDLKAAGPNFTRASCLYSGASGGSVGLMYFLNERRDGHIPPAALQRVRDCAQTSSLSTLGWGLAYPDFTRAWFPGGAMVPKFLSGQDWNRGVALELAWQRHPLTYGGPPLTTRWSDWVNASSEGRFPAVVFNAFDITHGYRVLFNTVQFTSKFGGHPLPSLRADWKSILTTSPLAPGPDPIEDQVMSIDLDVVTAARLSATFPYVTPIATPDWNRRRMNEAAVPTPPQSQLADLAVADGGYFDNAGVMSAVEWIRAISPAAQSRGVKRIVILEIRAFQRQDVQGTRSAVENWRFSVLGPILGMMKTRQSSQMARNDLDLMLMASDAAPAFTIEHLIAQPSDDEFPLSWHLTQRDFDHLDLCRTKADGSCTYPDVLKRFQEIAAESAPPTVGPSPQP